MMKRVEKMIRERDVTIPSLLFYHYKKLGITAEEVLLLTYLINADITFNPKKISTELYLDLSDLMDQIEHLKSKNLITIELKKIGDKRMELINMDGFYEKLIGLVFDTSEEKEPQQTIYDIFEKEFGRTLSPMEYEIINAWQENNIGQETIVLALKEAVYNGVNNLRYIDKILYEWQRKGFKTMKEVSNRNFQSNTEGQKLFDYNWLDDNE